ncbi:MAG: hypothetical protein ACTSU2_11535 [Promethearchaeota archaeon]
MPIRINWTKSHYLGLFLFFFGLTGLLQSLTVIPLGQYYMDVGSIYVLILVPIGINVVLTYSSQVLYEVNLQKKGSLRRRKRYTKEKMILGINKSDLKNPLIVFVIFFVIFLITEGIAMDSIEGINAFVIAENVAAISVLIFVSIIEKQSGLSRE